MEIRPATPEDLPWLDDQLKRFADSIHTKYSLFPIDQEFRHQTLTTMMRDHLFLIAQTDQDRIGFVVGLLINHPFNPEVRVLTEALWWVIPAQRGTTRAAVKLLDAFIAWGRIHADWIYFASHRTTNVTEKAFLRRGFREEQRQYLLEVD